MWIITTTRARRKASACLLEAVVSPSSLDDRLERATGRLLVQQGNPIGETNHPPQFIAWKIPAVCDSDLDLEGVATVDRGRTTAGGEELRLHFLQESREHRLGADRHETIGGWRHDLGRLNPLVERFGLGMAHLLDPGSIGQVGMGADLLGDPRSDPAEVLLEERTQLGPARPLQHLNERPEFDPLRMRLDLLRLRRKFIDRSGILDLLVRRRHIGEPSVRVRDRRLLEVLVDGCSALLIATFELDGDLRPMSILKEHVIFSVFGLADHLGSVPRRIHLQKNLMGRLAPTGLRDDQHRLPGGHESVHACGGDTDALLTPAHLHSVELRSVEKLSRRCSRSASARCLGRCPES